MNIFNEIHKQFYNICNSNIHKNIIDILQQPLSNNILLYGTNGLPHNILIDNAMYIKYGDFKKKQYTWEKELIYNETPYYIEIDLGHICQPKNIDTIITFLKNIITHKSLNSDKKIIIYCDKVSYKKFVAKWFKIIFSNISLCKK